ncbi:MAG: DNA gyrase subunit A, partial [Defluviitaleaceae bacterium]|nr:DNA gyrase subunit A [Defluviitaleaceae bacterium]
MDNNQEKNNAKNDENANINTKDTETIAEIQETDSINTENVTNTNKIVAVNIEDEMKKSYIDYAMSVIVARALPDVRDGLKPVHRRILYSMIELNLEHNKAYKKSARITGDVMGKYHPHGNSSIYDALVRMAQDFSMRYPLVDGHGNFGSLDGDEAAAERYTEARLSRISMEMLTDIEKETINFTPNYTEELKEPVVLPSRFPNLLVNGSQGIAVGMATNIPPHNLTEIIDATLHIIDNLEAGKDTEISELTEIVQGPDFPTGATILGKSGILRAYATGRGKVMMRSVCDIVPLGSNREMIIIKEIPYQVNKARLIEKIADLVKEKRVEGISDLRDETDRNGIRVVIELKKDANAKVVLNSLYKYTQLQETFGINMIALVNNEPRVLNLKEMLVHYLNHQKDVVTRRSQFELAKAEKRLHLVEGFLKSLVHMDIIIDLIRNNRSVNEGSKPIIMRRFGFTQEQADAIVEMRLRSLSGLERERLEREHENLSSNISYLKSVLENENQLLSVIREELTVIRNKFGDKRRTEIFQSESELVVEDLINDEMSVITLTNYDYIKRLPLDTYKIQNRGGKGVLGLKTRDEDNIRNLFLASTHDDILFITTRGRAHKIRAYQIPEAGRTAKGTPLINLLDLAGEKIAAVIAVNDYSKGYLVLATKQGVIKKTLLSKFKNINKNGMIALNFQEGDSLVSAMRTNGDDEIFVASQQGKGIRFHEKHIRESSRTARGARAMRLDVGDAVIGAEVLNEGCKILFVSELGFGKCTEYSEIPLQARGGKGLRIYNSMEKSGNLTGIAVVNNKEELIIINDQGVVIRIRIVDIATTGRVTTGVKLINLEEDVKVIGLAK